MGDGMKEVKKYAHIKNDMSSYDFWSDYIDWREPTPEDEIDDNRCYVEYGDYTAAITRAETAEAKLANIKDNISLIGQLVCPAGHGANEHVGLHPLRREYVCGCGAVLFEHTETIAVSKIRAILEVTE